MPVRPEAPGARGLQRCRDCPDRFDWLPRVVDGPKGACDDGGDEQRQNLSLTLARTSLAQIFVRAFDFEDRLVGLAFLEVNIYVTTLRTVKNLLLMGDAVRSVSLLAFQEDPFKLVPLGRDYRQQHIVSADFLIDGDEAAFVASDREGNLRVLEYNPAHIEAEGGQRLVHAAEYYHGTELSTTVMLARRTSERELTAPQSQLMLGAPGASHRFSPSAWRGADDSSNHPIAAGHDGSICTMIVVPGPIFKRLSLLQGQLLRSMQQFSGLNPRAYRCVSLSRCALANLASYDCL
jgi:cleavage and polyadenylation specificity factor subunit 1